jgi:hypothetical protein
LLLGAWNNHLLYNFLDRIVTAYLDSMVHRFSTIYKMTFRCFGRTEVDIRCSSGQACHYAEPGFFRVCYASMAPSSLEIACGRLTRFAEKKRRKRKSRGGEVEIDVIVRNSH